MRRRRGAQAVEFALMLPVLGIMLSGVVDVSQYIFVALSVGEAIADGAQTGSLADVSKGQSPSASANTVATNAFTASEAPGTFSVRSVTQVVGTSTILTVTGTVTYTPFVGLMPLPRTIVYSNSMRLAYP